MSREHDHLGLGIHRQESFCHGFASAVSQGQIEDQQVGAVGLAGGDPLGHGLDGGHDLEVQPGARAEHRHQELGEHQMVFDDHAACGRSLKPRCRGLCLGRHRASPVTVPGIVVVS